MMEVLFSPHLVLTLMACAFVIHAAVDSPCDSQPCLNGGTCHPKSDSFHCVCPSPIFGPICNRVPCGDNAKCVVEKRGVVYDMPRNNNGCNQKFHQYCVCENGFEGDPYVNCTDINECNNQPCLNNGTCKNRDGSFKCMCPGAIWGPTCNRVPCGGNAKCVVEKKWGLEDRLINNDGCNQKTHQFCICENGFEGNPYVNCTAQ
ncbi:sushi, nidogen and EGF-like domain-containing protein 1 isoform X1 [Lingula anatina]|uniref:Sushi, nidogen and EGF-like domain-containing protein 1 isoform X1 n=1 Tax=Lingula anatina TaxID=7574 RepID=A0A1S3HF10_LINAN|nr:sushi, nidogen and EGF-like domain-containing protein 1 isoform X1 [Lingula anatina]|eukprot:XP_013384657.1 sushi, nidogen and EGF-like domain-containing protein 1 isoform X1 [Lingula anatina]